MKLNVKKDERFTQGSGTAAKAAIKDSKEIKEKMKAAYDKKNEEVILDNSSTKKQVEKKESELKNKNVERFTQTEKMITVEKDGVHIYDIQDVKKLMLSSSELYGYITKQVNPKNFLFGWVKYRNFIMPTYDIDIIYCEDEDKYYAYSNKYEDEIPVEDLTPVTLKYPGYSDGLTVNFDIYKYLKFDGIFFTPGTGLKLATDMTNFNLIDMSQFHLRRVKLSKNIFIHFFVPVEETEENLKYIPSIVDITGYRNDIATGVADLVKFAYEFTPAETSNVSLELVKEFIHGKEFAIPHELATQAKTICNAIETGAVTLSQLRKLSDILKIRFDVVVSEDIRNKVKFALPPLNEKNKGIYEMTDMTEEEYNILTKGIEISEGIYGFEDLVAAFESGNYDIKDVQFILDKFRESTKL